MSKEKMYRIGVIGAGAIAQQCHLPGYAKDKRATLMAVVDPNPARIAEVDEKYPNLASYADYKTMFKEQRLDVVSVCTPNKDHAKATIAALEAGCHVLCEKPMAGTLKEVDAMMAAAKAARKKLMIGFTHRLFTGTRQCKTMLERKALGKPFMLRIRFAHGGPFPGWAKDPNTFYKPEISLGGALLDMGIHAIDMALWLYGPIVAVSARTATLVKKIPVEDNVVMLLEFKNGALGYIESGWTSKPGFFGIEAYGSEGSLICDYLKGLTHFGGNASPGKDGNVEGKMLDDKPMRGGWETEIAHWMDCVTGKDKLALDGRAGRNALLVALAAYQSSKTGKRVVIA